MWQWGFYSILVRLEAGAPENDQSGNERFYSILVRLEDANPGHFLLGFKIEFLFHTGSIRG